MAIFNSRLRYCHELSAARAVGRQQLTWRGRERSRALATSLFTLVAAALSFNRTAVAAGFVHATPVITGTVYYKTPTQQLLGFTATGTEGYFTLTPSTTSEGVLIKVRYIVDDQGFIIMEDTRRRVKHDSEPSVQYCFERLKESQGAAVMGVVVCDLSKDQRFTYNATTGELATLLPNAASNVHGSQLG
ncbi:hypothetical protein DFH06DRAFT_1135954 [Mycena polygramma]|nr:hypothetical protein DFH06DRAFT_1135954 [Mycena polygramma]